MASSMQEKEQSPESPFSFATDREAMIEELGKERLLENLRRMLRIRHFETRAEAAYLQGKVGGFFHAYTGQEAVQTSILEVFGPNHWFAASYRCHALALLLGATPAELMCELYGRANGNALGRGGSMHMYTDRLLGGSGIVGGQVPLATGAAFTSKYNDKTDELSFCFLGDGAVAQGAFHESLNLAALWDLPCIYVIENNLWGMGTSVDTAISVERIAESKAPGYGMKGYTLDGMDFFHCAAAFKEIYREILETQRPVLVEVLTERFKGHSISDPGLYRSKEELKAAMERDPIVLLREAMESKGWIDEATYKELDKVCRDEMVEAMKVAEESPWPDPHGLEEDVFAP